MAKFFGMIGYGITEETSPGVYTECLCERPYYGDIVKDHRRWESGERLNDNLNISNTISIVADEFAYANIYVMRYVEFLGSKWKINSVSVERPRLVLEIGGVYHEESPGTSGGFNKD